MNNFRFVSITNRQKRIFFSTLFATFAVVMLHLVGVKAPVLISPLTKHKDVFYDVVTPKLEKKENTYHLHKQDSIIPVANASEEFDTASAYAAVDFQSGEVLASKNIDAELPIASLTKVMTAIVALDLADLHEHFEVSDHAASMIPTKIGVKAGQSLTLDELLQAAMLTSANDAVQVIKEGIDKKYGERIFVRAMNEKAQALGLKHSSFANPQGFDNPDNYSSVEDLAILTHYALTNYPRLHEIVKLDYVLLPEDSFHKQFDLYNWNGLIGVYPNTIGMKIGNTEDAGKTTIVVSEREGKKMIAVVLGAPGIYERDLWAADLLDLAYKRSLGIAAVGVTKEQLQEKYQTWKYW